MESKIVERDGFTVVGMEYFGDNKNMEIRELWSQFGPRMSEIPNPAEHGTSYGICDSMNDKGEFSYLAGIAVTDDSQIPEGMKSKRIPAGKYAVFTHKGSLDKLDATYDLIYKKWLPNCGCELRGYDFELYDERFKFFEPDSEFDIYIAIK